jgi:CBS domain containing-hemolysin-like protein
METGINHYGFRLFAMALIIAINAFFAAAETALVSVRPSRLKQLASEGQVGAHAAIALLSNPERLLSVSQVGLTLASLGLGWLGEETLHGLFMLLFGPLLTRATTAALSLLSLALAFALMTYLHVVLGEVVPKNMAFDKADRLAVLMAPVLLVFYKMVGPFVWVLERTSSAASRLLGVRGHQHGAHSAEELKFVLTASHTAGLIEGFEESAMRRLLELRDCAVREVMVPRTRMVTLAHDADIDEVLDLMIESRYSRLPVCLEGGENPVGYLHVKDVLNYWAERRGSTRRRRAAGPFHIESLLRKAPIVPESLELHRALDDLREQHAHLALVVDEFGTVTGMISLEDLFEQVFGEIEDEFDQVAAVPEELEDAFDVEGTIPLRDLETQYGVELPSGEGYETLAGYMILELGRIPAVGDSIVHEGRRFSVTAMEARRVERVHIETEPSAPDSDTA